MRETRVVILRPAQASPTGLRTALEGLGVVVAGVMPLEDEANAVKGCSGVLADVAIVESAPDGDASWMILAGMLRKKCNLPVLYAGDLFRSEEGPGFCSVDARRELSIRIKYAMSVQRMDDEMVENRTWLSATLTSIADGVVVVDQHGVIKFVNPVAEKLLGREADVIQGRPMDQIVLISDERTGGRLPNPVFSAMQSRSMVKAPQNIFLSAGDKKIPIGCKATPIVHEDGVVHGAVLVLWDVTLTKITQQALARSEEKYRVLVQGANSVIVRLAADGRVNFINDYAQKFLGWTETELAGKDFFDVVLPPGASRQQADSVLRSLSERVAAYDSYEMEMVRRNGERVFLSLTSRVYENAEGVKEMLCVGNDITAIKNAERALRESELRFRVLADTTSAGIILISGGKIIYANAAAERILGFDKEELAEMGFYPEVYREMSSGEKGEGPVRAKMSEMRIHTASGDRWILATSGMMDLEDRSLVIVTFVDITDRKVTEQSLEKLRRDNELILNCAGEGIMGVDLEGRVTFINNAGAKMLGCQAEKLLGGQAHSVWRHSAGSTDAEEKAACPFYGSLRDGIWRTGSDEILFDDSDTLFPVEYSASPIIEAGTLVGAVVVFKDITERRRIENDLKSSEAKFRTLFEDFLDAIYIVDRSGRLLNCNQAFLDMFGYGRQEVLSGLSLESIFCSDGEMAAFLAEVDRNGAVRNYELKLRRRSGDTMDCIAASSLHRSASGHAIGYEGVIRDVTEQKRAQEALKRAHDELERRVVERTVELQDAQRKLVQSEKLAALGRFASGIAHEIKNPLGIILGGTEYILSCLAATPDFATGELPDGGKALLEAAASRWAKAFEELEQSEAGCLERLNALLSLPKLYEHNAAVASQTTMPRSITEMAQRTAQLRALPREELMPADMAIIKYLNRQIMESAFPDLCPRKRNLEELMLSIKIKDATLRADTIVKNLLKIARPSEMNAETVPPEDIIDYALSNIPTEERNHVSIETSYENGLSVNVDRNQITQVIINLIVNACQAVPRKRGGRVRVRTMKKKIPELYSQEPLCVIEIEDDGVGIKREDMVRLFEPFFTTKVYSKSLEKKAAVTLSDVQRGTEREGGVQGTGLGLSVSKSIINSHKGELFVRSVEGTGTVVTVALPLAAADTERQENERAGDADRQVS